MDCKRYLKKGSLKIRNLGSMFRVYDYESGIVVELNESAKQIWSMLDDKPLDDIARFLVEDYGIDYETAEGDVDKLVRYLEEKGIIFENRC